MSIQDDDDLLPILYPPPGGKVAYPLPKHAQETIRNSEFVLVLQISSRHLFSGSHTAFCKLKSHDSSGRDLEMVLNIFNALVRRVDNQAECLHVASTTQNDDDEEQKSPTHKQMGERIPSHRTTILELVPTTDDDTRVNAYRFWCFYKGCERMDTGSLLTDTIQFQNSERGKRRRVPYNKPTGLARISEIKYTGDLIRPFTIYTGRPLASRTERYERHNDKYGQISEKKHPLNPGGIFSCERLMKLENGQMNPEFCKRTNYINMENGRNCYSFPSRAHAYLLQPHESIISRFYQTCLPKSMTGKQPSLTNLDAGTRVYTRAFMGSNTDEQMHYSSDEEESNSDTEDDEVINENNKRLKNVPVVRQAFVEYRGDNSNDMPSGNIQDKINAHITERARIRTLNTETRTNITREYMEAKAMLAPSDKDGLVRCFSEYSQQMHKYKIAALKRFAGDWSSSNVAWSACYRNVIKWGETTMDKHNGSIQHPVRMVLRDVSIITNLLFQLVNNFETITDASTCHVNLLTIYLCVCSSPDEGKNKCHYLALGEAARSKSFSTQNIKKLCIQGTISEYTFKTLKADTGASSLDGLTEMFDEAPDGWVTKSPKGDAQQQQAMLKHRMTNGVVTLRDIVRQENGKRKSIEFTKPANGCIIANTNNRLSIIPEEVLSRMLVNVYPHWTRMDKSMIDSCVATKTPGQVLLGEKFKETMQWLQYWMFLVNGLISHGILAQVSTAFSDKVLPTILDKAGKMGLRETDDPRCSQRVLAAVRVLVIMRAVVLHFGGDAKEDERTPFTMDQVLLLEPDLVDHDPAILVAVLGLFQCQWENALQYTVVRELDVCVLGPVTGEQSISLEDAFGVMSASSESKAQDQIGRLRQEYVYETMTDQVAGSKYNVPPNEYYVNENFFPKTEDGPDKYRHQLALKLSRQNSGQGSIRQAEIKTILKDLEQTNAGTDVNSHHYAVIYHERDLLVSKHLLKNNTCDKLGTAVRSVLNYNLTQPMNCMFGFNNTMRHKPNLLRLSPDPSRELSLRKSTVIPKQQTTMLQNSYILHDDRDISDKIIADALRSSTQLEVKGCSLDKRVFQEHCERLAISDEWRTQNTNSCAEPVCSQNRIESQWGGDLPTVSEYLES
jgi:hypothetical protein